MKNRRRLTLFSRLKARLARLAPMLAIAFAAFLAPTGGAHALLCSGTMTDIDFGTINPAANVAYDGVGTLSVTCLALTPSTLNVCVSIGAGSGGVAAGGAPRYMLNGATQLRYNLYYDAARTIPVGSYEWAYAASAPGQGLLVNLTLALLTATANVPIYARIPAGQQTAPTGSYSSVFSGGQTHVTYGLSLDGLCPQTLSIVLGDFSPSFTVRANNPANCTLSASNMIFPTTGVLDANVDATSTLTATCSAGAPYAIGLGLGVGVGVTAATARKMTSGANTIRYGLYRDAARAQPFGPGAGELYSGAGTGLPQPVSVYGRAPPQTTPPPGTYSDTIIATLTY